MTPWIDPPRRRDTVAIPTVWLAVLLSLLIHGIALFITLRTVHPITASEPNENERTSSLAVQLAPESEKRAPPAATPPPSPPPTIALAPRPERPPPRRVTPRPPAPTPPPPVLAAPPTTAAPTIPVAPRVEPVPAPTSPRETPAPRPVDGDLSSYVEARRRERGEVTTTTSAPPAPPATPAESDRERLNRTVAANLGLNKTQTFGYDPRNAGGLFQIVNVEYDAADFYFLGLNKTINRNTKQKIEVRRGNASDIRVAVVRKMIEIIRDEVSGDFTWMSRRGGIATLSARPADNAQLEAYILHDIFPEYRGAP